MGLRTAVQSAVEAAQGIDFSALSQVTPAHVGMGALGLTILFGLARRRLSQPWAVLSCDPGPEPPDPAVLVELCGRWYEDYRQSKLHRLVQVVPRLAMEVCMTPEGARYYMVAPRNKAHYLRQELLYAYPGMHAEWVPDELAAWVPPKKAHLCGGVLRTARPASYPLLMEDNPLLDAMRLRLQPGETIWYQVLIRALPDRAWKPKARRALEEGGDQVDPFQKAVDATHEVTVQLLDALTTGQGHPVPRSQAPQAARAPMMMSAERKDANAAATKLAKLPGLAVLIRYVVTSPRADRATALASHFASPFITRHNPDAPNWLYRRRGAFDKVWFPGELLRRMQRRTGPRRDHGTVLAPGELAPLVTMAHIQAQAGPGGPGAREIPLLGK